MSRRIDNLTCRIIRLAAQQPAPSLVLLLDDGSRQNVFGTLPEALAALPIPEGRRGSYWGQNAIADHKDELEKFAHDAAKQILGENK